MGMIIMNGKEYTSSPKDGFPPIIYSDEEREIGVWRDGKPLYQKTINFGAMPNSSSKNVAHNISNLGYVVKVYGVVVDNSGDFHPIPDVNKDNASYQIAIEVNSSNIRVVTGYNRSTWETSYITLLYTKTTDVVGSGKYTTYGGLTHHYSTNEQVVGTWTNGKPLYEKTIEFTNKSITANSGVTIETITGISIKQYIGHLTEGSYDYELPDPGLRIRYNASNGNLEIRSMAAGWSNCSGSMIIRYTKTTD